MQLLTGIEIPVRAGDKAYTINIGTGTAVIEYKSKIQGGYGEWRELVNVSASDDGKLSLSDGLVKATLGGDATATLGHIK